jgi:hypothetical protein
MITMTGLQLYNKILNTRSFTIDGGLVFDDSITELLDNIKTYLINTDPDVYIETTKQEADKREQEGEALQDYINNL